MSFQNRIHGIMYDTIKSALRNAGVSVHHEDHERMRIPCIKLAEEISKQAELEAAKAQVKIYADFSKFQSSIITAFDRIEKKLDELAARGPSKRVQLPTGPPNEEVSNSGKVKLKELDKPE